MASVEIHSEFGLVILTAVTSIFMLIYKSIKVGQARKLYDVPYPIMYSTDEKGKVFNCYQRAHQNTLENYPQFLVLLIFGGLQHPVVASVSGMVWITARIMYARGYYTGDPSKRMKGSFGYIGLLTLLGCTISLALHLLQVL